MNAAETAASLELLSAISLDGATKVVVTNGKLETGGVARTFNAESGYPAYPALLETLSRWAEVENWPDRRFRDGFDLMNLGRILQKETEFDFAVLLRDGEGFEERWPALLSEMGTDPYLTFAPDKHEGPENLLLNLRAPPTRSVLDLACDFYLSGRSFAVSPYNLKAVLDIAREAAGLMGELGLAGDSPINSSGFA
jgi:hypothetical protein